MLANLNDKIYEDIVKSVEATFKLTIGHSVVINRGWLNLKWKIESDRGIFLVKQYDKNRFKKYDPQNLHHAFQQQQFLKENGFPCPKILTHQGEFFQISDNGERFIVMEYCEGNVLAPHQLNKEQMFDFGEKTGAMHQLLNYQLKNTDGIPQFVIPKREERIGHWHELREKAKRNGKSHLIAIIDLQLEATHKIDFEEFTACEKGWAHRDLWTDNLLFKEHSLSTILDFDRLNYDYLELDVARAIASCTLLDGTFIEPLVTAFLAGYRTKRNFSNDKLKRSLTLLWLMESAWWIDEKLDELNSSAARFAKEMIWLSQIICEERFPIEY